MNADMLLEHFHRLGDAPDAVPRLRRFILDLAVQGRLVEQNAKDEPVEELLERISKQRARLQKQGEVRSRQPLPDGSPEEVPFTLPANWAWVRIGQLGLTQTGTTPSKNHGDHFGDHIPFIKPADLLPNAVVYDNEGLSETGLKESGRTASAGSLLMVCIGTIGKCQLIDRTCSFNQQINSITPYGGISSRYLLAAFRSDYFQRVAWASSTTSTLALLNKGKWEVLFLPLPPLPEQHRIVAKVDELMALCDRLEAAQQEREQRRTRLTAASWQALTTESDPIAARFALEQLPALTTRPQQIAALRQAILDLAVRGRLEKQDVTDEPAEVLLKRIAKEKERLVSSGELRNREAIPEVDIEEVSYPLPSGWAWGRVGQLGLTQTGTTPSKNHGDHFGDHIPFVKPADLLPNEVVYDNEGLSAAGLAESGRVAPAGSILMVCIGTIGKCQVIRQPCSFNQQINSLTPYCGLDPDYLLTAFRTSDFHASAWAASTTSTLSLLNKGKWEMLYLPIPPLAEQRRIVAKVDELLRLCDALEAALVRGEAVKGRLLEAVLHTEVVPRTQPPAPAYLRVAAAAPKPQRAYVEAEMELAMAAEPVAGLVKRGPGRPRKAPISQENNTAEGILGYLQTNAGWHGKAAILEATGVAAAEWNAAIKELLEAGKVERQGEKKGARYRSS